jgi:folate-dependent phosphoribosylglycinamide formyltransferase PurN
MRYIYLTSEFLGSGAALQTLVDATPEHKLVGVFISSRRHTLSYLWKIIHYSGLRCTSYFVIVGFAYRFVQAGAALILQLGGQAKRSFTVAAVAFHLNVPLFPVKQISTPEVITLIEGLRPDLVVSVLFDQRVPAAILRIPVFGSVNVHPSLLPEFAGRAPVIMALAQGHETVGITVHFMNEDFDAGDILYQHSIKVCSGDSVLGIQARLMKIGLKALAMVIQQLGRGLVSCHPQELAKRSYQSEPDRKVIRDLIRRGWRLLSWREFVKLSLETLIITDTPT